MTCRGRKSLRRRTRVLALAYMPLHSLCGSAPAADEANSPLDMMMHHHRLLTSARCRRCPPSQSCRPHSTRCPCRHGLGLCQPCGAPPGTTAQTHGAPNTASRPTSQAMGRALQTEWPGAQVPRVRGWREGETKRVLGRLPRLRRLLPAPDAPPPDARSHHATTPPVLETQAPPRLCVLCGGVSGRRKAVCLVTTSQRTERAPRCLARLESAAQHWTSTLRPWHRSAHRKRAQTTARPAAQLRCGCMHARGLPVGWRPLGPECDGHHQPPGV
jgi:hypothetical protein